MLYIMVLYHLSYKFTWNDGVYTDIIPHYWTQAVKCFKLNCVNMDLHFRNLIFFENI